MKKVTLFNKDNLEVLTPHFDQLNDEKMYKAMRETMKPTYVKFKEQNGTVEIVNVDRQIKEDKIEKLYEQN